LDESISLPASLLPHRYLRRRPHIYSDDEIARLLAAARRPHSPRGLRAVTYTTVFGLLAATGLRISEALALDAADVDFDDALQLSEERQLRLVREAEAKEALSGGALKASGE
jgi:integrase/recombinase XerD